MEMARVKSRVARSNQLLLSLEGERERWGRQSEAFGAQTVTLVGNSTIASTFLAYMGMFDQESRGTLMESLRIFLRKFEVSVLDDIVVAGNFSTTCILITQCST